MLFIVASRILDGSLLRYKVPCLNFTMQQWVEENLEHDVLVARRWSGPAPDGNLPETWAYCYYALFETERDLLIFKLRWSDDLIY